MKKIALLKIDILHNEYEELKNKYLKNKTLNSKEDYKNKLIELDYVFNSEYEKELDANFPMTTTLEKEENRLVKLISYIEEKSLEQRKLASEYKRVTGDSIELSYLKYSDNVKSYKERLNNVKKIVSVISEIKTLLNSNDNRKELKLKLAKNKLIKQELLNLLYEFCLIDNLDIKEIDVEKLIENEHIEEKHEEQKEKESVSQSQELSKNDDKVSNNDKDVKNAKESKEEKVSKKAEKTGEKEEDLELEEDNRNIKEQDENILTSMPIVDKIGSVVPVNVFESLQKTEEKLPDVVLPSNGLKDDENDIFIDTKDLFEENEKNEKK